MDGGRPIGIVVVMGVAGSGKSTVGAALASRLGVPFVEGDDFHDPDAIRAMAGGRGLTDEERTPWLDRIHAELRRNETGCVCACSALTAGARARLSTGLPVRWVWLHAAPGLLAERLAGRTGHPVGVTLLPSQLATLEAPGDALALDAAESPVRLVERICAWLDDP